VVTAEETARGRRKDGLTRGSHTSAREGKRAVPVRVFPFLGCGLDSSAGPKGFPEAQFYIFISLSSFPFLFSISFTDFV
jgi:hypothetical protein